MSFLVFAQGNAVDLDRVAVANNAARFFGATVAFVAPESGDAGEPESEPEAIGERVHHVSIGTAALPTRVLRVVGRMASTDDTFAADRAEASAPPGTAAGLAALASRCQVVFTIDATSADDRTALLLAAVLATVTLGPILGAPRSSGSESEEREIFGVRTARTKLETTGVPYRS